MQPKTLPSSLRSNKRYIIYKIISEKPVKYIDFTASLWNNLMEFLGEIGTSQAKVWMIHNLYDEKSQIGIIRCLHDSVEKVRAVLSLITVIGESRSIVQVKGMTGTIKSAKTKYMK